VNFSEDIYNLCKFSMGIEFCKFGLYFQQLPTLTADYPYYNVLTSAAVEAFLSMPDLTESQDLAVNMQANNGNSRPTFNCFEYFSTPFRSACINDIHSLQ